MVKTVMGTLMSSLSELLSSSLVDMVEVCDGRLRSRTVGDSGAPEVM